MEQCFLISYDIADNRLRGYFFRRLKKIAIHLQKSVFFYEGNCEKLSVLEKTFEEKLTAEDNVLILPCPKISYDAARIYSGKKKITIVC